MEEMGDDMQQQKTEMKQLEEQLEEAAKAEKQKTQKKHGIDEYQELHDSIKKEEELCKKFDAEIKDLVAQEETISKKKQELESQKIITKRRTKKLLDKCNENMKKAVKENSMLQGYPKEKTPAVVMPKTPLEVAVESKEQGDM